MNPSQIYDHLHHLANQAIQHAEQLRKIAEEVAGCTPEAFVSDTVIYFHMVLVSILAGFVGYYSVWRVTPALHAPLMALTNAISSVVIVGALLPCLVASSKTAIFLGALGVVFASLNIFGGFVLTARMVAMMSKTHKKS